MARLEPCRCYKTPLMPWVRPAMFKKAEKKDGAGCGAILIWV
jgi:hypothetical protein